MSLNLSEPISLLSPTQHSLNSTGVHTAEHTLTVKVFLGLLLCVLIFVAVGGNMLVCAAVLTDRRLKKNCNFFIVSLAIADLLVASSVMTFAVPNDVQGVWLFGTEFCNIWISADIMCSTASILNLCVISLDRYIHIKDPLRYDIWMTGRKTGCLIATVWILSLLISFLPIHLGWHFRSDGPNTYASDSCIFELSPIYAVLSSTVSFYIPCIVMVAIYCRLYVCAQHHAKIIKKTQTAERFQLRLTADADQLHGAACPNRGSEHKAAVTLGVIMGVFLLCWLPFFVMNPINAFCPQCIPDILYKVLTWLGYVNSCLNPIIYSIFNQEFRDAFRKILLAKFVYACDKTPNTLNVKDVTMSKSEYVIPGGDIEKSQLQTCARRNSREHLFSEKVTAL